MRNREDVGDHVHGTAISRPTIPLGTLQKWHLFNTADKELLRKVHLAHIFGGPSQNKLTGIFVTTDDDVYSIGCNMNGCLGIGTDQPEFALTPLKVESLCGAKVKVFSSGHSSGTEGFCFAITESGDLYSWGFNTVGQLGHGNTNFNATPTIVGLNGETVKSVACGRHHALAVTTNGELLSWGYNKNNQLGLGFASTQIQRTPSRVAVAYNVKIQAVACGPDNSCALSDTGEVYIWGFNGQRHLRTGALIPLTVPTKLNFRHPIKQIECSCNHTMLLTEAGEIYTFGSRMLGNGTNSSSDVPIRPILPMFISQRIATFRDLSACQIQGDIYVWGEIHGKVHVLTPIKVACSSLHDAFASLTYSQAMHNSLIADGSDENYRITSTLEKALLNQSGTSVDATDVEFLVDGKIFKAHKSILIMRSVYFATRFSDVWKNHTNGPIKMADDIKSGTFWAFLYYIYTDKILDSENILDLLVFADSFCETDLKQRCEGLLRNQLDMENVLDLYIMASRCHSQELKQGAFDFAVLHWEQICAQGLLENCGLAANDYPLFLKAWAKLNSSD